MDPQANPMGKRGVAEEEEGGEDRDREEDEGEEWEVLLLVFELNEVLREACERIMSSKPS